VLAVLAVLGSAFALGCGPAVDEQSSVPDATGGSAMGGGGTGAGAGGASSSSGGEGGAGTGASGGELPGGAGGGATGGAATMLAIGDEAPDFSLLDVNATSPTAGQPVSPRDYLEQVSGWYFGHAT
jgi:hypothetical protein